MSPQTRHSLIQYGIMLALAVLGFFVENQTGILDTLGLDAAWQPVIIAGLASLVRVFEGLRDAHRAEVNDVRPADVGYETVAAAEAVLRADAEVGSVVPISSQRFTTDPFKDDRGMPCTDEVAK